MKKVAMIGIGAMGERMAKRLLDAGYEVKVFNRTRAKAEALVPLGASLAASPRDASEGCDVVFSMVRDDEASKNVWLDPKEGALAGLQRDAIAVESSTLSVAWVKELAQTMTKHDRKFLDAPVVGSRPQAEAGQLAYLVGGEKPIVEAAENLFHVMGGSVHHVGPRGTGTAMKLAVNALFGIQVAALSEILGLLQRNGIAVRDATEVLSGMPITSAAMKGIAGLIAAKKFDPLFPIELVEKDFSYVCASANEQSTRVPVAEAARSAFATALERGHGHENIAAVARLYCE